MKPRHITLIILGTIAITAIILTLLLGGRVGLTLWLMRLDVESPHRQPSTQSLLFL